MPQIILGPQQHAPQIDGSVRGKAYNFLAKLAENDTVPGLHIEPIVRSVDPRVRTGRVDSFWRAVLFKVQGREQDAIYVYLGVWPHDEATEFAMRATLQVNPVNGIAELLIADAPVVPSAFAAPSEPQAALTEPLFTRLGLTVDVLVNELGLDTEVAELAFECGEADEITELAELVTGWQGVALIDLSAGRSLEQVKEALAIDEAPPAPAADPDAQLAMALEHPAARLQFAFIEDDEELRRAIEDGDFAAWRIFLHPEQRKYAERSWKGPFRLSGGAGTGKTVVALHRARTLARKHPGARVLLTTFNKTLADALQRDLKLLDSALPMSEGLGEPGVYVRGVDATVRAVLQSRSAGLEAAVAGVLGPRTADVGRITDRNAWRDALASDGSELPPSLRSPVFLQAEYELIVLPNRVKTFEEYARVRRPGRGIALDRSARAAVWKVISAYRLNASIRGTIDFAEAAAIAADVLDAAERRPFDHVLVDEGQDLGPAHWQFLRALVADGDDDLFIAEDSHQRIYGNRVVLGRYGIKIVGRSQRLRLNYRTTAQNLRYAVSVLTGTEFVDLEEQAEDASEYRSARVGPVPRLLPATDAGEEFDTAAAVVGEWLKDAATPETIGVLVRTEQLGEQLVRGLDERGIAARFVSDRSVPTGKPVVMTMHRAKGMEFSRALIFGADASALPAAFALRATTEADRADVLQREKSLLYVATTRARDELAISWHGDVSELLPS
ncbi:AAA domain-containing protein [Solirubrobacter pauli]|uniref:DNA 3'-5' helicase n=1 Tax=Solirubrobacter pauli TaxID=166793 RepID=A0A660LAF5_9ACTN|nr:3'-5' exonuclease [Solirubrobacter pauli]RKQ90890.1 AAA domain-containing protein [Solirubrobacter pauli]